MRRAVALVVSLSLVAASVTGCTANGPRRIETPGSTGAPQVSSQWYRVAQLEGGNAIQLTRQDGRPVPRIFVTVDDSVLVVLNPTDETVPRDVRRRLRRMASARGGRFLALARGETLVDGALQLGPEGVLVDGRKVADLAPLVELVARKDVKQITGPVVTRGSVVGTAVGAWLGIMGGLATTVGGGGVGTMVGVSALGIFLGSRSGSHTTDGLVYRAAP